VVHTTELLVITGGAGLGGPAADLDQSDRRADLAEPRRVGRLPKATAIPRRGPSAGGYMSSSPEFVRFVVEQFDAGLGVTHRKMFGEYGLFCDGKMFGMVCDDRFFVKPTEGGRAFIDEVVEAPPYPGAKPSFLIDDRLEDREWLSELARITTRELPQPKPRRRKKRS
jgi:TfoX/Sxy family transcriptional regulator of competence genes